MSSVEVMDLATPETPAELQENRFPFDDYSIHSRLDKLAEEHPEFAEPLRSWRTDTTSEHRRNKKTDDIPSEQSESKDQPSPLKNTFRNTVPDMQQRQEYEDDRGKRSHSAPPDQGKEFASTHKEEDKNERKEPVVHHIPIFVEGRDEPIFPRDVPDSSFRERPDSTSFRDRPDSSPFRDRIDPTFRDRPDTSFRDRPDTSFRDRPDSSFRDRPDSVFRERHMGSRGSSPSPGARRIHIPDSGPKPQHHSDIPGPTTIPIHFASPHADSDPHGTKIPVEIKPDNSGTKAAPSATPSGTSVPSQPAPSAPPKPPVKLDPIEKVKNVQDEVTALQEKVDNFQGSSRTDKDFIFLDEMLTRNLLKLDNIETEGRDDVRSARKETIRSIQRCISLLERKVPANSGNSECESTTSQVSATESDKTDKSSSEGAKSEKQAS